MKKILILIVLVSLLYGCQEKEKLTIMVPQGSPAMTILGLDMDQYAVDIVNGPDPLVYAFGSSSHDAIIAPTNLGAKLYQSKDNYKLAAVLVWGNYHVVSTRFESESLFELDNQSIIVFGKNQTSDIIIKHLIASYEIDVDIIYVDSVQTAAAEFIADPTKMVMVAEPSLSKIKTLIPDTQSIDLQKIYAELHDDSSFPQASLFVKQSLDQNVITQIINHLDASIGFVNHQSDAVYALGVAWHILDNIEAFKLSIDGSHLLLKRPDEVKDALDLYLNLIINLNPQLIGGQIPDENFYWSDDV